MVRWALLFFIISIVAAYFGFAVAIGIAKILFYIFLGAAVVMLIAGISLGHRLTHHR